jgi:hypothetical protein
MTKQPIHTSDLVPDPRNANKGTQRGRGMLEDSIRQLGLGRSIVLDKNGVIIAGNKTAEVAVELGLEDLQVVHSDGKKLVAVMRDDLDLETDPEARRLAVADNRVGEISLDWDAGELQALLADDAKALEGLFTGVEVGELLAIVPDFKPVGIDEQGRLDEKAKVICPECGCEFAPK